MEADENNILENKNINKSEKNQYLNLSKILSIKKINEEETLRDQKSSLEDNYPNKIVNKYDHENI